MSIRSSDVVVVGGSTAGLWTASLVARAGVPVRIVERNQEVEPIRRTLIVTGAMRDLLGPLSEGCVVNEIRRFELLADHHAATVSLERPDLVIERSVLIRDLSDEASARGADVLLGRRFRSLRADGNGFTIGVSGGGAEEMRTGTVVGADGAFSAVGRAAGWPRQPTVSLLQAIVGLPTGMSPDTTRVWFRPRDTPYFYWLVPESPERGALGVIGEDGADTRRRLDHFIAEQGLEPLGYQAARIPLYTRWRPAHRRLEGGDVYLVGDAAGHVKPSTVGGVVTGLRGAQGVAEAITSGRTRTLRGLRRELDIHRWLRIALHRWTEQHYVRLFELLDGSVTRHLGTGTRDEAATVLRRICMAQPRLLLMGVRSLLTGAASGRGGLPRA